MLNADQFIWAAEAMTVGVILTVAAALFAFPGLWTLTVGRTDRFRVHTLDGARGLLTIWVLSGHLIVGTMMDATGDWHPPAGTLTTLINSGFFVAPFFMLTAMLYGGRLVATRGKISTVPFMIRRAFRLLPGYTLAISLLVFGAFLTTGFELQVSPLSLVKQIGRWMMFDFVTRYDINGVDMAASYGLLWTLRYEMIFYAVLPVVASVQRRLRFRFFPVVAFFALGYFMWPFLFFGAGTLAALLIRPLSGLRARIACQFLALGGILIIVFNAQVGNTHPLMQAMCMIPLLVCLALEAPVVRPLSWRPLRLIGEISYSNYVIHGAILYLFAVTIVSPDMLRQLPLNLRIGVLILMAAAVLVCALICYLLVERPFVELGARFSERTKNVPGLGSMLRMTPLSPKAFRAKIRPQAPAPEPAANNV